MKLRILSLCLLTAVWVAPAFAQNRAGQSAAQTKAEAEVIAFLNRLTEAGFKRDVAEVDRVYADDYIHTNSDGSIMTKSQVLASYKSPPSTVVESDRHDEDRVWVRGDVAYVNTRVTIKGRTNNQPYERQWRVTYLFAKTKGVWRAVTSHASLIPSASR